MKTQRNILIAFLLNLAFALFELAGGLLTGSTAILSDAVHDIGDAAGIGLACLFERKSKRLPDEEFPFGYARYSVAGGLITTLLLMAGSVTVICYASKKLLAPTAIRYDGMILFALIGVAVNFCAAWLTREGDSINQKAVNLHMLEDVLGWAVVLVGAVVMRFTGLTLPDPLMSIGIAVFLLIHSFGHLKEIWELFLMKTPHWISVSALKEQVLASEGVREVRHIRLWSMDGRSAYAAMHIVADADAEAVKKAVRSVLTEHGIVHATLELEAPR